MFLQHYGLEESEVRSIAVEGSKALANSAIAYRLVPTICAFLARTTSDMKRHTKQDSQQDAKQHAKQDVQQDAKQDMVSCLRTAQKNAQINAQINAKRNAQGKAVSYPKLPEHSPLAFHLA